MLIDDINGLVHGVLAMRVAQVEDRMTAEVGDCISNSARKRVESVVLRAAGIAREGVRVCSSVAHHGLLERDEPRPRAAQDRVHSTTYLD